MTQACMPPPFIRLGIAVLTVAIVASGCGSGRADSPPAEDSGLPLPVTVASPRVEGIVATYRTTGTLVADVEAAIPARQGGDVVELLVEEGDRVHRGDVLARLDGERARLEAQLREAEYQQLAREYARLARLQDRGLISRASYETLEYELRASEAARDLARLDYARTAIRSTVNGIVSSRTITLGDTISAGRIAFVVTDTQRLVAYLDIPQNELSRFAVGQTAAVGVDSLPARHFEATLERISPTVDTDSGTFRATLSVDGDGELVPGMFGRFAIEFDSRDAALTIPADAAVIEDAETVVFVVENGEAVRRRIETGIRAADRLEVVSGLSAQDRIVVSGIARLREGTRVLASATDDAPGIRG